MSKLVKTCRLFLFGMCCILMSLYLKRILLSFEIIKGNFLSNCIVLIAVIWFVAGVFRLHHLNKIYPGNKNVCSKDKWCMIETGIIFILAAGLSLT